MGDGGRLASALERIDADIRWALKWFGAIALVLIAFYIVLGYNLEESFLPTELGPFSLLPSDNRLRTVGIAASSILTFALIYVYKKIGDIQQHQADQLEGQKDLQEDVNELQRKQTEILEKQEEWMRFEHTPKLSIESWSADGREINVYISNVGNGVANELTIKVEFYPPEEEEWEFDEAGINLIGPLREEHRTRAKQPGLEPVEYKGIPRSSQAFDGENEFSAYSTELEGSEITYVVAVLFEDISGEKEEKEIWVGKSEISGSEMTIEGMILNTTEDLSTSGMVAPDSW